MLTINDVNTPSGKTDVIERSFELAYKAYYSMSTDMISDKVKD